MACFSPLDAGLSPTDCSCFHRGQAGAWWGAVCGVLQTPPHGCGTRMELCKSQACVILPCNVAYWGANKRCTSSVWRVRHFHKSARWRMCLKVHCVHACVNSSCDLIKISCRKCDPLYAETGGALEANVSGSKGHREHRTGKQVCPGYSLAQCMQIWSISYQEFITMRVCNSQIMVSTAFISAVWHEQSVVNISLKLDWTGVIKIVAYRQQTSPKLNRLSPVETMSPWFLRDQMPYAY